MPIRPALTFAILLFTIFVGACDASSNKMKRHAVDAAVIAEPEAAETNETTAPTPDDGTLLPQVIADSKITIFGEMHGNANSPEVAGDFAEEVLSAHGAVTVALEIPARDQRRLENYLQGPGRESERCELLRSSFWSPDFADGRSSQGKLDLLDRLRVLRHEGHDIDILAFDRRSSPDQQAAEESMAAAIIEYVQSQPERRLVVLTGNVHARRTPFETNRSMESVTIRPMSQTIAETIDNTTTIKLDYQGGTTLARTQEGFGELELDASPRQEEGLHHYDEDDGAYDYYWMAGEAVPSPPAAELIGTELDCDI